MPKHECDQERQSIILLPLVTNRPDPTNNYIKMRCRNGTSEQTMEPVEIISRLESALIKLDNAHKSLAATKIAEAIEILKIDFDSNVAPRTHLHHDND
ncbi:MAG: hypothetical protein ABJO88_17025 [Parasphingorhabdus sp.]